MTCCGKTKRIIDKAGVIAKSRLATVIGKKYEYAHVRRRICRTCEFGTWLTRREYAEWLLANGIKVLTNLDDLTKLPPLPKKTEGNKLYCSLCKCPIVEKSNTESEKCPNNKWEI